MERECQNCDHMPNDSVVRDMEGEAEYDFTAWDKSDSCKECRNVGYGEPGCNWSISPILLDELK